MTPYLLDVNVLIGLIDPTSTHHEAAHRWFASLGDTPWATCPLTENAVLRIIGNKAYSNSPGPPAVVAEILSRVVALPGHVFWPDAFSLLVSPGVDLTRLLHPDQITDTYLISLARSHGGQLATFDRRIIVDAVPNGAGAVHWIS